MSEHEHDEEEVDFIEIDFDDGSTVRCEVQGIFELDGDEYIALLPDDDSDEVYLYGYKEYPEEGTYELVDIESDELFQRVSDRYDEAAAEEELELAEAEGDAEEEDAE
ncbi:MULTISPECIES: DUF1292 domain-containing protein [Olsenella]|uniref:DUF1292 domain-containing protein n=1 Tax=Olsenella TaxID=133925 RepID=UPI00078436B1|nr:MULTISPECIES: DUF1292 domain-containing protein [Olsenella]KXB61645.1 hypothetical protein HMPREF1868_01949 [Olsenella sp. DNF00959]